MRNHYSQHMYFVQMVSQHNYVAIHARGLLLQYLQVTHGKCVTTFPSVYVPTVFFSSLSHAATNAVRCFCFLGMRSLFSDH